MFKFNIYLCSALLMLGSLLISERAEAACDSVTVTNLNFGEINPVTTTGHVDVTATVHYECELTLGLLTRVAVCIQIGSAEHDSGVTDRSLRHGGVDNTEILSYNVYSDAARTSIWGDVYGSDYPPVVFRSTPVVIGAFGRVEGNETIYGRLDSTNFMLRKFGNYSSILFVTVRVAPISLLGLLSCTGTPTTQTLNVSANLVEACTVSANPLNFGSHSSNFASPVQSTSTINTACSKGSNYQIGLNNGQNAIGATRRMKAADGSYISYELYNNSSYTQRWGSTKYTSEVVQGIATGQNQQATVYGQVQPQPGLKAATYEDTITVTVTY